MSPVPVSPATRHAGSLPFPGKPAGAVNPQMPFDHIVVVMMENHSLDNLLGALAATQPNVDGLRFDSAGNALNSNPTGKKTPDVKAFPFKDTAQLTNVTQTW